MRGAEMKLFRDAGKRVHRLETPVATYLSREEAISLAHVATETAGLRWDEPIAAGASRDEADSVVVWTVVTKAMSRGTHVRVRIDDSTGNTIEVRRVVT
jgi:CubicO group peptidase (beta-lactamase class C family)